MTTLLRDARFGLRLLRANSRLHRGGRAHAGARHRGHDGHLQRRLRHVLRAAAVPTEPTGSSWCGSSSSGERAGRSSPGKLHRVEARGDAPSPTSTRGAAAASTSPPRIGPRTFRRASRRQAFSAMLGYGHPLALGRTFHRGRRHARAGQRRHPDLSALAGSLRRRSADRRAGSSHRRRAAHRRRRAGRGPADHQQNKVWLPLAFTEDAAGSRTTRRCYVMARLKDGVTVAAGQREHGALSARGSSASGPTRARAGRSASSRSATTSSATAPSGDSGCCWAPWDSCC